MTKWREAGNFSIGSERLHLLTCCRLKHSDSLDSVAGTRILSASCRKSKHLIYFLGNIWTNWKKLLCLCSHMSFRVCNNELSGHVFYLLLAKSLGFQGAFKFKLSLLFMFYYLELRCSHVSNPTSPCIWGHSYLLSEWFLISFFSSDISQMLSITITCYLTLYFPFLSGITLVGFWVKIEISNVLYQMPWVPFQASLFTSSLHQPYVLAVLFQQPSHNNFDDTGKSLRWWLSPFALFFF